MMNLAELLLVYIFLVISVVLGLVQFMKYMNDDAEDRAQEAGSTDYSTTYSSTWTKIIVGITLAAMVIYGVALAFKPLIWSIIAIAVGGLALIGIILQAMRQTATRSQGNAWTYLTVAFSFGFGLVVVNLGTLDLLSSLIWTVFIIIAAALFAFAGNRIFGNKDDDADEDPYHADSYYDDDDEEETSRPRIH